MELERIVVNLVANSTGVMSTFKQVQDATIATMKRMEEAGNVDPFKGMSDSMKKMALNQAAVTQQLRTTQAIDTRKFNEGQLREASEFQTRQQNERITAVARMNRAEANELDKFRAQQELARRKTLDNIALYTPRAAKTGMPLPQSVAARFTEQMKVQNFSTWQRTELANKVEELTAKRANTLAGLEAKQTEAARQHEARLAGQASRFSTRIEREDAKNQAAQVRASLRALKFEQRRIPVTQRVALSVAGTVGAAPLMQRFLGIDDARMTGQLGRKASDYRAVTQDVKALESALSSAISPAMRLIALLGVGGLAGVFAYAGSYAIKTAANIETLAVAFEVLMGGVEKSQKVMKDVINLGINSPFRFTELATVSKGLAAFGFEAKEIIPTLRVLGELSSGTGTPLQRISLALGQIKVAGRLMGPEMRQLIDAGIPIIPALAKVMDKPEQAIKNMVENAEVGWADVAQALNQLTQAGGTFFGLMDRQSQTTQGRWNALVETVELGATRMGLAFFQEFGVAKGLEELRAGIADVIGLSGNGPKTMTGGVENSSETVNFFKELRKGVQPLIDLSNATSKWMKDNRELLLTIAKVAGVVLGLVVAVKLGAMAFGAIMFVVAAFKVILVGIGVLVTVLGVGLATAAIIAIGPWETVGAVLDEVWTTIKKIQADTESLNLGKLFTFDTSTFNNLFDGVGIASKEMWAQFKGDALGAFAGIKDAIAAGDMKLAFDILFGLIELGWKSLLATMKAEWINFANNFAREFSRQVTKTMLGPALQFMDLNVKAAELLGANETAEKMKKVREAIIDTLSIPLDKLLVMDDEALKARLKEITDAVEPFRRAQEDRIENAKVKRLFKEEKLATYDSEELRSKALELKMTLTPTGLRSTGAFGGGMLQEANRIQSGVYAQAAQAAKQLELAKGKDNKTDIMYWGNELKRVIPYMRDAQPSSSGMTTFGDGTGGTTLDAGYKVGAQAVQMREEIVKAMNEGKNGPEAAYKAYKRDMSFLEEAYRGPIMGKRGGAIGAVGGGMFAATSASQRLGSVIDGQEYKYGVNKLYDELIKTVGVQEHKQPTTAYRGSVEAQDIINDANMNKQTQTLDQIRANLDRIAALADEDAKKQTNIEKGILELVREGVIRIVPRGF